MTSDNIDLNMDINVQTYEKNHCTDTHMTMHREDT